MRRASYHPRDTLHQKNKTQEGAGRRKQHHRTNAGTRLGFQKVHTRIMSKKVYFIIVSSLRLSPPIPRCTSHGGCFFSSTTKKFMTRARNIEIQSPSSPGPPFASAKSAKMHSSILKTRQTGRRMCYRGKKERGVPILRAERFLATLKIEPSSPRLWSHAD